MADSQTQEEITTVSSSTPAEVVKTTKTITPPIVQTEHPQKVYETKKTIFRTYQVIWYILGLIEILMAFRIGLKMLAADPNSTFVNLIYLVTDPLALPFMGIFRTPVSQGSVFELSSLVAMLVYALVAYGIIQLMQMVKPTNPQEVERKVDNQ